MKKALFILVAIATIGCKTSVQESPETSVEGTWELDYISAPGKVLGDLYPNEKPSLVYNESEKRVSGNNGCNSYTGEVSMQNGTALFGTAQFITTRMFCPGEGEKIYMGELAKVNKYNVSDDGKTLTLIMGDIATMRFHRK